MFEEVSKDPGVDELRVARYRKLIVEGRYHRTSRQIADAVIEQDLKLFSTPPKPFVTA